jgi:hypothetical protein
LIYARLPVPEANEERVRELISSRRNSQRGMLFGTVCAIGDTTHAYAWVPQ